MTKVLFDSKTYKTNSQGNDGMMKQKILSKIRRHSKKKKLPMNNMLTHTQSRKFIFMRYTLFKLLRSSWVFDCYNGRLQMKPKYL